MERLNLPPFARALLDEARVGHLGLLDDTDLPRVLPVTFAIARGAVYTAVDQKPKRVPGAELARVRFLRRRPEAAFTVDVYDDDWSRLAWVQLLGRVEVTNAGERTEGLEALSGKYSQYRERTPEGPLLRLEPERALSWSAS